MEQPTKPRISKLERQIADAEEHLEQCKEELVHAQSMGNDRRIAQVERWLAEAEEQLEELQSKTEA